MAISPIKYWKPRIFSNWYTSVCASGILSSLPDLHDFFGGAGKVKYKLKMKFRWETLIIWRYYKWTHNYHPLKYSNKYKGIINYSKIGLPLCRLVLKEQKRWCHLGIGLRTIVKILVHFLLCINLTLLMLNFKDLKT